MQRFASGKHPRPIVERIYRRLFPDKVLIAGRNAVWELANDMFPEEGAVGYNTALLDLASAVCVKPEPYCDLCFARKYSDYYQRQQLSDG